MGKLILVKVTAIYDDVELDQDEETGDPIKGSWTEHRRDWFYEDREDTFPEGNVVLTWERGKWDYDTRFGIYLIWKDLLTNEKVYGTVTQLLDCMDRADRYMVCIKVLDVKMGDFIEEWQVVDKEKTK